MCKFCEKEYGKGFRLTKCFGNKQNLKWGMIHTNKEDGQSGIVLFDKNNRISNIFKTKYCPFCGAKISDTRIEKLKRSIDNYGIKKVFKCLLRGLAVGGSSLFLIEILWIMLDSFKVNINTVFWIILYYILNGLLTKKFWQWLEKD